jgi:hypothetical protein
MSNSETDLDLDKLFLPAWAQESPSFNKYEKYTGREESGRRDFGDRRRRPPSRDFSAPGGKGFGGPRPGERGPRREGGRRDFGRGGPRRDDIGRPSEPALPPLPEVNVTVLPDEKGVDSLTRQIKMTGRAYPLFEIAKLILQKSDRQQIRFETIKKDDKVVQPMFVCALNDSIWLSEDEAIGHVLQKHFATFYQAEKTPTDPPKGTYTFVAQCGLSGVILGPPNYHDYQNQLHRLHTERFATMPFERFKSRVRIVKDEPVVKKWIEDQSFKTEYVCLNIPEPKRLHSMEEVEKHFREVHAGNLIKPVDSWTMSGSINRDLIAPGLLRLARHAVEEQRRFPLKVVNVLSQQFAQRGLHFFKVNKTITHVSVARPNFLDLEATPISDGVKKIVEFIAAHPKCTRRHLFEKFAPDRPVEKSEAPAAATGTAPAAPQPTPEQTAIIADLHWLIHQGHVIEFANATLETAKKPHPRPPAPEKKKVEKAPPLPGTSGESVPNESVETIEPKVAELEAAPVAAPTPETPQAPEEPHQHKPAEATGAATEDAGNVEEKASEDKSAPLAANP